jgi:hypothetical protein
MSELEDILAECLAASERYAEAAQTDAAREYSFTG